MFYFSIECEHFIFKSKRKYEFDKQKSIKDGID